MTINYDVDGEISLLGTCLMVESCRMDACQTIKAEYFHSHVNQKIFKAICDLYHDNMDVNLDSIASKLNFHGDLENCAGVLSGMKQLSIASNYKVNKEHLIENWKKTKIQQLAQTMLHDLDHKSLSEIAELANNFGADSSRVKTYSMADILTSEFYGQEDAYTWLNHREEAYQKGDLITGLSTGFPRLDGVINGLNPGNYITVAAVPGGGKTTFAIQMMKHLVETGVTCGFISLEMSRQEALIKLTSIETNIPFGKIAKGNFNKYEKDNILIAWGLFLKNKHFKIQDGQIYDLMELKSRLKYLVEVQGVKALFIDYITLIDNNKGNNLADKVQQISSTIRQSLVELQVPGVIVSQLNRASSTNERPPQKHDLFGSSQIEKDSHQILMLHPEGDHTGNRRLFIRKNRQGQEDLMVRYTFENGIFKEVEKFPDSINF